MTATLGPWHVHGARKTEVWSSCGSILVADCKAEPRDPEHRAQALANAKLIAAAPSLADALEELMMCVSRTEWNAGCHKARSALRLAGRIP